MSNAATAKYITVRKLFAGYLVKNMILIIPVPRNLLHAVTLEYQLKSGINKRYRNATDMIRLIM
jgi:hypothetical protein